MKTRSIIYVFFLLGPFCGCSAFLRPVHSGSQDSPDSSSTQQKTMVASFYGNEFAGKSTASGETFVPAALTAAHRTLPFGTRLRVKNPQNGKVVEVRVNDRGPFAAGRDLDLSHGAAASLGISDAGIKTVLVEVLPNTEQKAK